MNTATKQKRAVPHIEITPALQEAIAAYSTGVRVRANPGDPEAVRSQLSTMARTFEDPAFFYTDETVSEADAVQELILIATLYREHLLAGNKPV